jgi:hypothetical protein
MHSQCIMNDAQCSSKPNLNQPRPVLVTVSSVDATQSNTCDRRHSQIEISLGSSEEGAPSSRNLHTTGPARPLKADTVRHQKAVVNFGLVAVLNQLGRSKPSAREAAQRRSGSEAVRNKWRRERDSPRTR